MLSIDANIIPFSLPLFLFPFFLRNAEIKTTISPFLFLTLDLPPPPLFQDEFEKNIIPQVTFLDLKK